MLRKLFNEMMQTEELNKLTGLNFVERKDLEIIVDDMNELELRELAANEMGDHVAYTVSIERLVEWYGSFKLGLMD